MRLQGDQEPAAAVQRRGGESVAEECSHQGTTAAHRCGVVWCGGVWCGVVWCGLVWCGVVWCSVV